jgi:hypothetical protein
VSLLRPALGVANAVLYEGYLLFPYTSSARKNQMRWQFGVLVPAAYAARGNGERAEHGVELLFEADGGAAEPRIALALRFLHVVTRQIEENSAAGFVPVAELTLDGTRHITFEEACERDITLSLPAVAGAHTEAPLVLDEEVDVEELRDAAGALCGRVVRRREALRGTIAASCAPSGAGAALRVHVRTANASDVARDASREDALRTSFVSAHVVLAAEGGAFLSALDPPPFAAEATRALRRDGLWPVLIGEDADPQRAPHVLAAPIILYDFPQLAKQTEGEHFDATEIDELLRLSVLSMSDDERAEARATDPRARAIVEQAERYGPEDAARLHDGTLTNGGALTNDVVLHDPFAAIDMPALDCVFIDGTKVAKGSAVRLCPKRRADVWDVFLAGKDATVVAIHQDVEGAFYVAVTVDDDPASDLHEWYGRSFFFYPDEVEPLHANRAAR